MFMNSSVCDLFRRSLSVFLLLAGCAAPIVAPAATPIGYFDGVDSNGVISGWAVDPDVPSVSIEVHVYMDGPAGGGGTHIGTARANLVRPDVQGNHGFRFSLPPVTRDGVLRSYWVYGIDASGGVSENRELSGSPKSAALDSTIISITNGVVKVGIEPRCGGTIAEITISGTNLVNNYDCTGRQIQVAHYDGNSTYDSCAACTGTWGWNPVQGGDRHGYGSIVLEQAVTSSSLYIKTQPYEWFPDNKGGGPGLPVLSDVIIEQWLSFVPNEPYAIKMRSKTTHVGNDNHSLAAQEHPATYINLGFDRLIYYGGSSPWTGGSASVVTPPTALNYYNATENWAAVVNSQGSGLTVYSPGLNQVASFRLTDPISGPYSNGFNYIAHVAAFAFNRGSVLERDIYLIAGDYLLARQFIYNLKSGTTPPPPPPPDNTPPYGNLEVPTTGQTLSGNASVSGWAFDNTSLSRVEILVDGAVVGTATYGQPRPDVVNVYPNISPNTGYTYALDTTRYPNGQHSITAKAIDSAGNVTSFGPVSITVSNSLPVTTPPPAGKFALGDRVTVTARRINIYSATDGRKIGTQRKRAQGTVVGGPVARNGSTVWNIDFDGAPDGLADQSNLEKVTASSLARR